MKIVNSKDYGASATKFCTYSLMMIVIYPIIGLLSVGVREMTNNKIIVAPFKILDMTASLLPFPILILGAFLALLAICKGHNTKSAVIGGLGNVVVFSCWFFVHWIVLTR
jgi:hypothetical protein